MHVGEHDVRADARAGDERAARADEHGRGRVEAADGGGDVLVVIFLRGLDADELDIEDGEEDGDDARAHGRDLRADEVRQDEHGRAGRDAREEEVGQQAAEALFAEGHGDHQERNDEHAEHVDAADHGGVERYGADARVDERCAAIDGREARAAPRAGRRVAEEGEGDGCDGVKAQRHEERGRDGRRSARAGRALEEDREHHADDDNLHTAVVADAGDGVLDLLNRARLAQDVEDDEGTEDHEHDLQTLLDALPEEGVVGLDVFGKRGAGDVKVGEGEDQRPDQGDGRDLFGRLVEGEDADEHDDDRAEGDEEVQEAHGVLFSLSYR